MDTYSQIDELMNNAQHVMQGTKKEAIVALCENVLRLLAAIGLLTHNVLIKPMNVGVHYDNRYGLGIKSGYVAILGGSLFRSGFRWTACTDAICVEEDDDHNIAEFTIKLQKDRRFSAPKRGTRYITVRSPAAILTLGSSQLCQERNVLTLTCPPMVDILQTKSEQSSLS